MNKDEYDILLKAVRGVEESITRVENDLADDRKDIDGMKLRLGAVEEGNKSIISTLTRLQKKTGDAVRTGVVEAVKPIEKKIDDWVEKKVIKTRIKKRSLLESIKDYFENLKDWKDEVKK